MERAIENKLESEQNENFLALSMVLVNERSNRPGRKTRVLILCTAISCLIRGKLHNDTGLQLSQEMM